MAGYYGDAYEQGGVAGMAGALWQAPYRAFKQGVVDPVSNINWVAPQQLPADYGDLTRPQHSIWDELFVYNPGGEIPAKQPQAPQMVPQMPSSAAASIPEASTDFTYNIPGKERVELPAPPSGDWLTKAIEGLKAPSKAGTDRGASLMEALGKAKWDQNASAGTNLFNIGTAFMAGGGAATKEELAATKDYEDALRKFSMEKLSLKSGAEQQTYQNQTAYAKAQAALNESMSMKPQVVGGNVIYGTPNEDGSQDIHVTKISDTAAETKMKMLQQLNQFSSVDFMGSAMNGEMPQQYAAKLTPKILELQQSIMQKMAGTLSMMDDVTKRKTLNLMVNIALAADPEYGPLVRAMTPEMQNMAAFKQSLK
jgi:hypothetical protein